MRPLWPLVVVALLAPNSSAFADDALFSSYDVLELTLAAPLRNLFTAAQKDSEHAVKGHLTFKDPASGRPVDIAGVTITTRGHTSKQASECEFPKLKIRFPAGAAAGSLFEGMKALKIGTHCGELADSELTKKFGRFANEKEPLREALVYRVLDAMGVPTLRARPARITYVFADEEGSTDSQLARNAMLLEDDDEAMKRYGATAQLTDDRFESAKSVLAPADVARLAFAEAMIGNFDWCLRFEPGDRYRCDDQHPLWNMLALVRADGPPVPVIYDFDLAGFVVPRHIWFPQVLSESFVASGSKADVEVVSQVQRTRSLFPREQLDATRAEFVRNKPKAYAAVHDAAVDPEGRRFAEQYLDAFFAAIESDTAYYRPVVVRKGTEAHLDQAGTQSPCGPSTTIPIGTPVSAPIETSGSLVRVRVLDVFWQWAPPAQCDAIHRQPVWIAADAIAADYPR